MHFHNKKIVKLLAISCLRLEKANILRRLFYSHKDTPVDKQTEEVIITCYESILLCSSALYCAILYCTIITCYESRLLCCAESVGGCARVVAWEKEIL